jgi:hypothetical protein
MTLTLPASYDRGLFRSWQSFDDSRAFVATISIRYIGESDDLHEINKHAFSSFVQSHPEDDLDRSALVIRK